MIHQNNSKGISPNDESLYLNPHGNRDFYEKYEIYPNYVFLKTQLKNKKNLSNNEIVEIARIYKKIDSSLEYMDELNLPYHHTIDELPEMDGLFTDILQEIISVVVESGQIVFPKPILEFQKTFIMEYVLCATEEYPLEDIRISHFKGSTRYFYTYKDTLLFEAIVNTGNNTTVAIEMGNDLNLNSEDILKIYSESVSITNIDKEIPEISLN